MFTENANKIFEQAIDDYHRHDDVDRPMENPHPAGSLDALLYHKNWIDNVQWHLEDIIRDTHIDPVEALEIKRRIDSSNQNRTDMVEYIDGFWLDEYKDVKVAQDAKMNTETPAWAIDRLSILALKIYHMERETLRGDLPAAELSSRHEKLCVLQQQRADLSATIDELLEDIAAGRKRMKAYRQMKMYNDPSFKLSKQ